MSKIRPQRVGDELRAIVSELLQRKLQDPRLNGVSIAEVRVSPDLSHATFYYSRYPADDSALVESQRAWESATGLIRREISRRLRLRATPELHFEVDRVPAHAAHIEELLAQVQPSPSHEGAPTDSPTGSAATDLPEGGAAGEEE